MSRDGADVVNDVLNVLPTKTGVGKRPEHGVLVPEHQRHGDADLEVRDGDSCRLTTATAMPAAAGFGVRWSRLALRRALNLKMIRKLDERLQIPPRVLTAEYTLDKPGGLRDQSKR